MTSDSAGSKKKGEKREKTRRQEKVNMKLFYLLCHGNAKQTAGFGNRYFPSIRSLDPPPLYKKCTKKMFSPCFGS